VHEKSSARQAEKLQLLSSSRSPCKN